ncbi:MAG: peptidyl-prolyl cis-trans isomerase [Alphaproteobacteria bacterium]|nr:peptidyl-prolyl cis-trans isomerase [Alphaproteobacteria bacterium]
MLKQMREGAKSTVLKTVLFGLLLLAMAGLALLDVQGMFRRGVSSNTIVNFGREKLTAPEFDRIVQSTLREQQMKQSDAYRAGLPLQILRREIDNRLFSMAANGLGLQVDDALAAKQVGEIISPLVKKGLSEKEALQRILQTYNLSEGQMVASLKEQLSLQQLLAVITSGAYVPQQLIGDALKYRHEWRRGEYFTLTAENGAASKPPADEELKAYYDSIAGEYALPEYRTLSVIVLDKKSLGDSVKISEDKLKQYYDDNIGDYKSSEARVISQVVAADEESAVKIHDTALKTGDLKKSAAAAGKDKGSYIKAGTFTEASMPVELSKPAFAGEAGKALAPVKSALGWHVLYIEKVIPGVTKPFDAVKSDIEKELSQEQISEAVYQGANKIDDEIAGGKTLSEVAKEHNLHEVILEKVDAHGMGQNGRKPDAAIPLFDKVIDTGFNLKKGAASQLIETPEGSFVIASAVDIFPSEQQSFDKVRADVLARWKKNNLVKALAGKSAKIMERLKLGESFDGIAKELGKTVQSTSLVQRGTPAAKANMNDGLMAALFSLDRTGHATTVSGDGSVTVIRLAERKIRAPQEASKEDAAGIEAILKRSLRQDLLEQYRMFLMAKYDVTINDKLMGEMYAPKDEGDLGGDE